MDISTRELNSSIENLRERGLSVVEQTRTAGAEFVDRTQRVTTEWLVESERRLLAGVLETLRELEARIARRLELLDAMGGAAEATAGEAPTPEAGDPERAELPIEDYDRYTAKEIVAELAELSSDAAKAILEYERAHKARATVIRAAEQKLVA